MIRTGLAVAGAALVLLGGAALTWGSSDEEAAQPRTDGLGAIRGVDLAGGSGDVEVRRVPGARAEVQQQVHQWWGGGFGDERHYTVDRGRLRLDGDCGWNCGVSYVVTLPTAVPVTGELGSGGLDVAGMASVDAEVGSGSVRVHEVPGPVRARTGSGEIELADLGDKVDVNTNSGEVEGRDIRGADVRAHSGSGGVTLALLAPGAVDVETGSGSLELTVPGGPYRIDSSTGSGEQNIEVPRDDRAPRSLRVITGSGDLAVRAA